MIAKLKTYWKRLLFLLSVDWKKEADSQREEIERSIRGIEGKIVGQLSDLLEQQKILHSQAFTAISGQIADAEKQLREYIDTAVETSVAQIGKRLDKEVGELEGRVAEVREKTEKMLAHEVRAIKENTAKILEDRLGKVRQQVQDLLEEQSQHLREQLTNFFSTRTNLFSKAIEEGKETIRRAETADLPPTLGHTTWSGSLPRGGLFLGVSQ